jgi:glycerol-3-phosphate dehydrogenase
VARLTAELQQSYPYLSAYWAARLIRAYGAEASVMLKGSRTAADLGRDFGQTLTEVEVRWLMAHEFARAADDIVWRRTKLGLRMTKPQITALEEFMAQTYNHP